MSDLSANTEQLMREGMSHHRAGRLGEAERTYVRVLAQSPDHSGALHLLGVIAHQAKRYDLAIDYFNRAITAQPTDPTHCFALGKVLKDCGRSEEAIGSFHRAIELKPEFMEALGSLGIMMSEANRWEEALSCFERASALRPESALIHNDVGNVLKVMGRLEEAIERYRKAVSLDPRYAEVYNNLGTALKETGHLEEAVASYRMALSLKPELAETWCNLGDALREAGDWAGAIKACEQAVALNPGLAEAYGSWGNALNDGGRVDESIGYYQKAIALKPGYAEGHNNLGQVLKRKGRLDEAITCFEKALALKPEFAEALSNLGCAFWEAGRAREGEQFCERAVAANPNSATVQSNLIFMLQYDARSNTEELIRWNRRHVEPLKQFIRPHGNDRDPERRLRIGYVSADFHAHVCAGFIVAVLEHHDPRSVEVFCYAQVSRPDEITNRMRARANHWRSIVDRSDDQIVEMIRQDQIDILVDLKLHTDENRLLVFARKPAPVQATWLGYPGTTGLETIDYRLSDPYLDPPGMDESVYTEKTVRLPDCFWCYEPLEGREIPVQPPPVLVNGHITFGSLNSFSKINEGILSLWARVLRQMEGSRLLILAIEGKHRQWAIDCLNQEGIDPRRVEFVSRQPRRGYFELFNRVDIALDTFPCNGHTTTMDALWMGVPVVSLVGAKAVGRAGLSVLTNVGLAELAVDTEEDYVRIASEWAGDPRRLQQLRSGMRQRMEGSPLMDAPRFAGNMEAAYRRMWRSWCATGGQ